MRFFIFILAIFVLLAPPAFAQEQEEEQDKGEIIAPNGAFFGEAESNDNLPDTKEYDDVPAGLLITEKKPEQEWNPDVMPRMPGIYKIPGMDGFDIDNDNVISMEDILAAYKKKDYKRVLQHLRPLAENGQHKAEELLGIMHMYKQGMDTEDYKEAFKWLSRAAEANEPLAQHYLGVMYFNGMGMDGPDTIQALKWMLIAIVHYPPGEERDRARQDRDNMYLKISRLEKTRGFEAAREWLERRGESHLLEFME